MNKDQAKKIRPKLIKELYFALEQISNHVMVTDNEGIIEYVNPAFERTTGYSKKEAVGRSPKILSSGLQSKEYYVSLWTTISQGKEFKSEVINKKKNGDIYVAEQIVSPIKDVQGNVTHFISIWDDITEQKRLENEIHEVNKELEVQKVGLEKTNKELRSLYKKLEKKNKELLKLDQLKSDFVSTVSHELRTPLAISTEGINLVVDGLAGEINEKQRSLLVASKENLERLSRIIDDLLDISKIESGKMELFQNFTDITKVIQEAVDCYQRVVQEKKIALTVNLPENKVYLNIDKDKIIQVVTNLLNNAYKFTHEKGSINVSLIQREGDVLCSVKDTGKGIAKEDMQKLFKKFQQFGREDGAGIKGTGLGLSICKNFVELHQGKIWAESKLGEGSVFFFTLPTYEVVKSEFDFYFENVLKKARAIKKPVTFVLIFLKNFQEIRSAFGEDVLFKIINIIFVTIEQVNSRKADKAFLYDLNTVYALLPETNEVGGDAAIGRIKEAISKCQFNDQKKLIEVDLKYGSAIFPSSAQDRKGLISVALEGVHKKRNILIVDDHPQVFDILKYRLKDQNYHVEPAYGGEEALKMIKESKPDLIILDIMMPKMNGYEVLGRLKGDLNTASIPVIILTAKNTKDVQRDSSSFGAIPIILKTGNFENLIKVINEII